MRILVVGAGAVGGYFGGRLLEIGRDVTFLVRPHRAAALAKTGLVIQSSLGDAHLPAPPTVTADQLREPYDLILLSCKAYDLDDAIQSFTPAVGPKSSILPLLNGMRHLHTLDNSFSPDKVLGGQCFISSALDAEGRIVHFNQAHSLSFGERNGARSKRIEAIAATMSGANLDAQLSETILQDMWEKWIFISAGAASTCLFRGTIGDIVAAGAADLTSKLFDECAAIASANNYPPRPASFQQNQARLTEPGSVLAASMLRDIERQAPIEADHIVGDLLRSGEEKEVLSPLLRISYANLKTYEARRERETSAAHKKAAKSF